MKPCITNAISLPEFLFLLLGPFAVKMEEEHSSVEDRINEAIPFRLLHKDVCPLVKDVLLETTYEFPMHCAQKCLTDVFCAAYNFRTKQLKKPNCQLTHKLDHEFHSCNKHDKGWNFHQPLKPRKVPCQKMKYCKYGGKTVIDVTGGPGSDPYKCECPKGFKGDLCEISPFLRSTILYGEPQSFQDQIKEWLRSRLVRGIICWRATVGMDGQPQHSMQSKCDNKVPTLTIVKVGSYIFGGYATVSWDGIRLTRSLRSLIRYLSQHSK